MTDAAREVADTIRETGRRRIGAGDARTAVLRRRYETSIDDLWEAITDPTRMSRWFIMPKGELRVGGQFSLEGNASGEILRCVPPRMFRITWVFGGMPADEVEVRLTPAGDGATILELVHATTADTAPDGSVDAILGVGVGWELAMEYLARHLRGDLPPPSSDASRQQDFEPTADDSTLMESSGRAWASIVGPGS